MKVLQINSFFTVGGPPRIMNGIYDTLIEHGYECKIAAAREAEYTPKDSVRIGSKASVYWNALKARILDNEGFNAKTATKKLIRQIEAYDPDIIHLHNLHGYYINIEILFNYLRRAGKPVVWTLHDCWAITGHCCHFDYIGCEKWKTLCWECAAIRKYPCSNMLNRAKENHFAKRALFSSVGNITIVAPSQWLLKLISESFLYKYAKELIYNGIDLEVFRPKSAEQHSGKVKILGVAQNWAENKGYDDYLKLAEMMHNEYDFIMVGLTQKQASVLPSYIHGIVRTNNVEELADLYSASDVFVNLTYEDNFPTVNLEALACGTPVITYMTGGSPESIDSMSGIVVEQGDIAAVAEAIKNIGDKGFSAEQCRKRAIRFDRGRKYNEYIELYKRLLATR